MSTPENQVEIFVELIRRASTQLPSDVKDALQAGRAVESEGSLAERALGTILNNVELARERSAPICQDTGTPVVWIHHPVGVSTRQLEAAFVEAVRQATERRYLRPNAVNTQSGKNTGDGTGRGIPFIHFHEWDEDRIEVRMILKGVRRAVLDAVFEAQGKGCAPGVLGVCVGGDRVSAFAASKEQLLRPLGDTNPDPELAELEGRILTEANSLGVGPMGFSGQTTLLGVKIGMLDRLPACYFVTVTYMCWADRKAGVSIDGEGEATWLN